jgi:hypothetical protein
VEKQGLAQRTIGVILALALLGAGAWLLIREFDKDPALVGSLLTAAGAVVTVVVGRSLDKRAELRQAHREQMAPLYLELIERVKTVDQDDEEAAEFWRDLSTRLVLYGPAPVIRAQIALSRHIAAVGENVDAATPVLLERLYRAMRADLGHDDKDLPSGDLLRLYITDIDDLLGPFVPPA